MTFGEFKQEILKIHNSVNMEVFFQGLHKQRVEIVGEKVIIIALNNRVKVLSIVDQCDSAVSRMVDQTLLMEFKRRFVKAVEERFGVPVMSLIKDYDPKLEMSVAVLFYTQPVDELLPLMKLNKQESDKI